VNEICIPRSAAFIHGSGLVISEYESITIDPNNPRFVVNKDFLIDLIESRLIRCFDFKESVIVLNSVSILGVSGFSNTDLVRTVTFESSSRLMRIDRECFSHSVLESICVPRSVNIFYESCFRGGDQRNTITDSEQRNWARGRRGGKGGQSGGRLPSRETVAESKEVYCGETKCNFDLTHRSEMSGPDHWIIVHPEAKAKASREFSDNLKLSHSA
jgi:hypothetical protein